MIFDISAWGPVIIASVPAVCGAFVSYLRYRRDMAMIAKGLIPPKLPAVDGPAPLLCLAVSGALIWYLFSQHPYMARLNLSEPDAVAASGEKVDKAKKPTPPQKGACGVGCTGTPPNCRCTTQTELTMMALPTSLLGTAQAWEIEPLETFPQRLE